MEDEASNGDPATPSRAHEQSPQAVSALRVSPAIADRYSLPRRSTTEQQAREIVGQGADWKVYKWQVIAPSGKPPYGAGTMVTGAVVREVFKRGPRKGRPNWNKPEPGTDIPVTIFNAQREAWLADWERDTGLCHVCEGTGQEWAGWNHITGDRHRDCRRCGATGYAPAQGIEVAKPARPLAGSTSGESPTRRDAPVPDLNSEGR